MPSRVTTLLNEGLKALLFSELCNWPKNESRDYSHKTTIILDGYSQWHCYSCLGMTKYLVNSLKKFSESKLDIFMSCKGCSQSLMPVAAIKNGASIEAKAIK